MIRDGGFWPTCICPGLHELNWFAPIHEISWHGLRLPAPGHDMRPIGAGCTSSCMVNWQSTWNHRTRPAQNLPPEELTTTRYWNGIISTYSRIKSLQWLAYRMMLTTVPSSIDIRPSVYLTHSLPDGHPYRDDKGDSPCGFVDRLNRKDGDHQAGGREFFDSRLMCCATRWLWRGTIGLTSSGGL